ncbi:MAG TPA: hypothetical protein VMB85_14460 [Bryobacteraceae bacterium]|nr:hypothetical protein [Bryobacteraceae bacterium]
MRTMLICPGAALRVEFEEAVAEVDGAATVKSLEVYPETERFKRLIRSWAPEVVFLSLEDAEEAARLCAHLDSDFPGMERIAVAPSAEPQFFRLALRLKMGELLAHPIDRSEIARILDEVGSRLRSRPFKIEPCDRFFAFMPAKAGVGASTIAAGVSRILKDVSEVRCLLADFDLDSGISGFLFNVDEGFSVLDALQMSHDLDEEAWAKLIRNTGTNDLLLSGAPRIVEHPPKRNEITALLDFVRRSYEVVMADIPDSFNDFSLAVLHEANQILLVTTPELAALRLARQKVRLLEGMEIRERVSLVLNRVQKKMELNTKEIEETVGVPIVATFPSDYADVSRAVRDGECPPGLIPAFQRFARRLLANEFREPQKTRFIERFAVVPMRYGFR